jgi:hypothetical protein
VRVPNTLIGDFALGEMPEPDGLWVFLPRSVPLPDPEGTPWEQRDGIAPGDAWWRVTGHFDDPRAQGCVPRAGDAIDGVPVVMSVAEVLAFCRNHFVVERLEWIPSGPVSREGPTSTGAPRASGPSTDGMPDGAIDRDQSWVLVPALLVAGSLVLVAAVVIRILGSRR